MRLYLFLYFLVNTNQYQGKSSQPINNKDYDLLNSKFKEFGANPLLGWEDEVERNKIKRRENNNKKIKKYLFFLLDWRKKYKKRKYSHIK